MTPERTKILALIKARVEQKTEQKRKIAGLLDDLNRGWPIERLDLWFFELPIPTSGIVHPLPWRDTSHLLRHMLTDRQQARCLYLRQLLKHIPEVSSARH